MSSAGEGLLRPAAAWRFLIGTSPGLGQGVSIPSAFIAAPLTVWPYVSETDVPDIVREELPAMVSRLHIVAESTAWLRLFTTQPSAAVITSQVTIVIDSWRTPRQGWSGRLGPLPFVVRHEVRLPTGGVGRAMVEVVLSQPNQLGRVVIAAMHALVPSSPLPTVASADVAVVGALPEWLVENRNIAAYPAELPMDDAIRANDVVIRMSSDLGRRDESAGDVADAHFAVALDAGLYGVQARSADYRVMVSATGINPRGRKGFDGRTPTRAQLSLSAQPSGWHWRLEPIDPGGAPVTEGGFGHAPLDVEHMRSIDVVSCSALPGENPVAEAALLVQMAMAGVVVHAPKLSDATLSLLAKELWEHIRAPLPGPGADTLEWDARSVGQRRAALRHHATGFAMPQLTSSIFPTLVRPPSVTALLVTKRPEFLAQAVAAIDAQTYSELEIILGLHGFSLTAEMRGAVEQCRKPLEVVSIPPNVGFGEALGLVTARARGSLLTKFDDDDIYGPEHVWDLVLARHFSGANVVGKGAEFVYLEPLKVTVRRRGVESETYAGVVTGGTLLLSRGDLEAVGGWRPVARSVDRGLLDRIHRSGGLIYRTHPLGFIYRRHLEGHTWDPGLEFFLRNTGSQWPGLPNCAEFAPVALA